MNTGSTGTVASGGKSGWSPTRSNPSLQGQTDESEDDDHDGLHVRTQAGFDLGSAQGDHSLPEHDDWVPPDYRVSF